MSAQRLNRSILPEIRVVDAARGIVDYVASDQTIDSYSEVIKADGWRFDMFVKNSPLVDSHNYNGISNSLGKVIDFSVTNGKLINRAQFAIDVVENKMAALAWGMVSGGYMPAVSVGFFPTKMVSRNGVDAAAWAGVCEAVGLSDKADSIRTIYTEQQQCELSVCILGANPNALLKANKDGVLKDADLADLGFRTDDDLEALTDCANVFDSLDMAGRHVLSLALRTMARSNVRAWQNFPQNSESKNGKSADAPHGADLSRREDRESFMRDLRSIAKR